MHNLQVGPARVEGGWRLRPEAEGSGEGVPLEGVLYLLTEEQLAVLDAWSVRICLTNSKPRISDSDSSEPSASTPHSPDGRRRALVGATLLNEDGTPGVCIEEDVLLYVPPVSMQSKTVSLPAQELGQVAYGACKAGLTPAYRAYLEGFVAAAGSTAGGSVAGGKHGQDGEEPQMTEVLEWTG